MTKWKKFTYAERGMVLGLTLCFASMVGAIGHRIYRDIDPLPIVRRYNELREDKEVKRYNHIIRCKSLKDFEEDSELVEEFLTILNDPEVKKYKRTSLEVQDIKDEEGVLPLTGAATGALLFFSSAIVNGYIESRKEKKIKENNND